MAEVRRVTIQIDATNSVNKTKKEIQSLESQIKKSFGKDFKIKVDIDGSKGISTFRNSLSKIDVRGVGSNLGSIFGRSFAAASSGVIGGIGFIGKKAFTEAANFEQLEIAFEAIIGDARLAEKTLDDLFEFAAVTPFETDGVAKLGKDLLLLEDVNPSNLIETLEVIGNVGAVTGAGAEEFSRLGLAIKQIESAGVLKGQETNQLSEALPGFPVIKALSAELGVTRAEFLKLREDGKLLSSDVIPALISSMESWEPAAGAMARQSETLSGRISALKDTFTIGLIEGIDTTVPQVADKLGELTPSFELLSEKLGETIGNISLSLLNAFAEVDIQSVFESIDFDAINESISAIDFGALAVSLVELIPAIIELVPSAISLADAFLQMAPHLATVLGYMGEFVLLLDRLGLGGSAAALLVANKIGLISPAAKLASAGIKKIDKNLLKAFSKGSLSKIKNFGDLLKGLGSTKAIKNIVKFGGALKNLGVVALTAGKKIALGLLSAIGPAGLIAVGVVALGVIIFKNWDRIKSFLSDAWNTIKSVASPLWEGIKSAITNPIDTAKNLISGSVDRIKGFLSFAGLKDTVSNVWNGIKDAISKPIESAWNFIKGIADKIKSTITSIPGVGKAISAVSGAFFAGGVNRSGVSYYAGGGVDRRSVGGGGVTRKPTYFTSEFGHTEAITPENASIHRIKNILGQTNILARLENDFSKNQQPSTPNNVTISPTVYVEDKGRLSEGERKLSAKRIGEKVAASIYSHPNRLVST